MTLVAHDVDSHEMIPSHLLGEVFGAPGRMMGELYAVRDKLRPDPTATNMHQPDAADTMTIDPYEVNEAFASVPLAWARELNADPERLNPRGGAIALGHPLGGSGVRLMSTLVNHLGATGGRYGLQTMCEGGGGANATLIERI